MLMFCGMQIGDYVLEAQAIPPPGSELRGKAVGVSTSDIQRQSLLLNGKTGRSRLTKLEML